MSAPQKITIRPSMCGKSAIITFPEPIPEGKCYSVEEFAAYLLVSVKMEQWR